MFEPTVIEDYKRRLSGVDSVAPEDYDPTAPTSLLPTQPGPSSSLSATPVAEALPPQKMEEDVQPEEEKKSFGGFKMSFKAAPFVPATTQPAQIAEVEEDLDVDGEDVDVDGAEVDVDGEEVDTGGQKSYVDVDADWLHANMGHRESDDEAASGESEAEGSGYVKGGHTGDDENIFYAP